MYIALDAESELKRKDVLEDNESGRTFHVKGKHPDWSQGHIIRSGACTRLIFP